MAYDAKVIQAMIASPGDVIEERDSIKRILSDWNDLNSAKELGAVDIQDSQIS